MKKNQTIELPVMPLRGLMLFPNMVLHFDVGRKKSLAALEQGMMEKQKIFLVSQKKDETDEPGWKDLCRVGTLAEIKQVMNLPGENIRVLVEGSSRGIIQGKLETEPCMKAEIRICEDRAVTFRNDARGQALNYEGVDRAVRCMRRSAPVGREWKQKIEADYKARKDNH